MYKLSLLVPAGKFAHQIFALFLLYGYMFYLLQIFYQDCTEPFCRSTVLHFLLCRLIPIPRSLLQSFGRSSHYLERESKTFLLDCSASELVFDVGV